jgi:hypothetical protein
VPLYRHESGEGVLVPADHPEAIRLAALDGWDVEDEDTAPAADLHQEAPAKRPRGSRTRAASTTDSGDEDGSEEPPPPAVD